MAKPKKDLKRQHQTEIENLLKGNISVVTITSKKAELEVE